MNTFCEAVYQDGTQLKIDEAQGIIYGVRVLGEESKNGRRYTDRARSEARALYEGANVNLNHLRESGDERRIEDSFGVLRRSREEGRAVYADLHYIKSHPNAPAIVEMAKRFPESFGLSHNAAGTVKQGADGVDLVESIQAVESVDVVRKPATNRGLFESVRNARGETLKTKVKSVLEKHNTHAEAKRLLMLVESNKATLGTLIEGEMDAPADGASADSSVGAAFEQMVIAVLRGDGDKAAKLKKIRQVLDAEEKLTADPAATPPQSGAPATDTATTESLRVMRRDLDLRNVLEDAGLRRSDLSEAQITLLNKQTTVDDMRALVESWPKKATHNGRRPAIGAALAEADSGKTYADLRETVRPKKKETATAGHYNGRR